MSRCFWMLIFTVHDQIRFPCIAFLSKTSICSNPKSDLQNMKRDNSAARTIIKPYEMLILINQRLTLSSDMNLFEYIQYQSKGWKCLTAMFLGNILLSRFMPKCLKLLGDNNISVNIAMLFTKLKYYWCYLLKIR